MRPEEKKNVTHQEATSTKSMTHHGDALVRKLQRQQPSKYKDTITENPEQRCGKKFITHSKLNCQFVAIAFATGQCERGLNLTQNELRMSKRNFPQRHLAYQPQHLSFRGNLKSMENVSKKLLSLELL